MNEGRSFRIAAINGDIVITKGAFWLLLTAIWILSFLLFHNLSFPIEGPSATAQQLADAASSGTLLRRLALPILAAIGIYSLVRYARSGLTINGVLGSVILAYLLYMTMSFLWSVDPSLTVRRLVAFATLFICASGMAVIYFERLPMVIVIFCGVNLAVGVFNELVQGTIDLGSSSYRFSGTLDPNQQAGNLSMFVLAAFWWLYLDRVRNRWLALTAIGVGMTFMLLTQSRTSLVSLLLALSFSSLLIYIRAHGVRILLLAICGLIAVGAGLLILDDLLPYRPISGGLLSIVETERDSGNPMSFTGRVDLWNNCIDYLKQRPVLGYGFGAFWSPERIEEISETQKWAVNQAHSGYLEHCLDLGLMGGLLYYLTIIGALLVCVVRYLRRNDIYGLPAALLTFYLIHSLLESSNNFPLFPGFAALIALFYIGFIKRDFQAQR